MNVLRDRIARRAAALLAGGVEPDIHHAIKQAAFTLGFSRGAPIPTESEVRKHLQGMAQESLGDVGYREGVQGILALAAELMDLLERGFSGTTLLAGRGARGHFDGGAEIHIRLYARAELSEIAQLLVDVGCEEPSFETIETTHGRANRVRTSMDGVTIVVVRCLPEWWSDHEHDLVTARPTATRTLKALRHDDPLA